MKENNYLTLPLVAGTLIAKREHSRCDLTQAIAQKIHLLTTTQLGEVSFDPSFGCTIWDTDFDIMPNINSWKDKIMLNLKELLEQKEPALTQIKVTVQIVQEEFMDEKKTVVQRLKRRLDLHIQAKLTLTNEPFDFRNTFYLSPISFD